MTPGIIQQRMQERWRDTRPTTNPAQERALRLSALSNLRTELFNARIAAEQAVLELTYDQFDYWVRQRHDDAAQNV